MVKGRFAPSPSGRMHLGNIFSALISWLSAKKSGGKWILRIEDLDPARSKQEYARLIEDDLLWLGLEWDEGGLDDKGLHGPYSQSRRHEIYKDALHKLSGLAITYPCFCSKADIMAANAPHAGENRRIYPGTCLPVNLGGKFVSTEKCLGKNPSIRIHLPDEEIVFNDRLFGQQHVSLSRDFGDIVLQRADGSWAYQLAVVIDDALMGVTEVVRGADLLSSAALQIYLFRLLSFNPPEFFHVPLICNEKGVRLSKRDISLSMEELRKEFSPSHLIGFLAYKAGLLPEPFPISAQGLLPLFSPSALYKTETIVIE